MEDLEKQIKDRVDEIHFEVYNMEDVLDGEYAIGMFGDEIPEIDKAHKEALQALRNYIKVLTNHM
jgi:hypothetical protein